MKLKVLQRLYPASEERRLLQPTAEDHHLPASKPPVEKTDKSIPPKKSAKVKCSAVQGEKLYTAAPPPEGYFIVAGDNPVTPSSQSPTESEDSQADAELHKRRKRRRKKKVFPITPLELTTCPAGGDVGDQKKAAPIDYEESHVTLMSSEQLTKNRKRKMKKKRHKEKLLAQGMVPRPRAVEFTYTQKEEGDSEELLDFLRTTQEVYLAEHQSSGTSGQSCPSLSIPAADSLFSRISCGTLPSTEISRLCGLRAYLGKNEAQLKIQLHEYKDNSTLPSDEVAVVCTLIEYWQAEILPMQREQKR
ncbi:hypothetical protein DNTS_014861 [Danionella cerebrum]|uniref:Glutamate-rich protein 1 n=1 Tax=Danionella cerebrum TaxID=2873325 RepID=A0A553RI86_9TELE|nr:hypothetical protein DNTS_014861 [Danionella translucida]